MNGIAQARNWTLALAGGAGVLLMLALALRLPIRIDPPAPFGLPSLQAGPGLRVHWGGNQPKTSMMEAAQLMDPTPLFMPTPLSVTSKLLVGKGIGDRFPALTPADALKFRSGDLRIDQLPPPVAMPAGPADALEANPPGNLAMGFGRTDQASVPLPVRQAWVEITARGTGQVVLRTPLPSSAVLDLPVSNWAPVHFSANVGPAGLVGGLIALPAPPAEGGFLNLDADTAQQLANYLELKMVIGQRLASGFYRISVGP